MSWRDRIGAGRGEVPLALSVLFAGTFVMGCAEMLVTGMLDLMAAELAAPLSTVGALVSANALGIAVGGPLLTFLTARAGRRPVLLTSLAVFALLNLLPAGGAGLEAFVAARLLIGAVEGLFVASAITTATSIVPPARRGPAMAVVISGFAVSAAVGMPLGRLLGEAVGWRMAFLAVAVAAAGILALAVRVVPRVAAENDAGMSSQLRFALAPRVLAVLAVGTLLFAGVAAAQTYLVPLLDAVVDVPGTWIGAWLMGFGVAAAAGSFAGGRFAHEAGAALALIVGGLGVAGALMALAVAGSNPVVAATALVMLAACGAAITSPWQHRVEHLAGPGAILAASLPASAGNLGDAIGAFVGGRAIDVGGIPAVMVAAAVLATGSVAAAVASRSLRTPRSLPTSPCRPLPCQPRPADHSTRPQTDDEDTTGRKIAS